MNPLVIVACEGESEANVVKFMIAPHLRGLGLTASPRHLDFSGKFERLIGRLRRQLREVASLPNCHVTTLIDYYGLTGAPRDVEGMKQSPRDIEIGKRSVEDALRLELAHDASRLHHTSSFRPYVQMHELEALFFSDTEVLARELNKPQLARVFQGIRDQFPTPEHINDNPNTAPSKRIIANHPGYKWQKTSLTTLISRSLSLATIRASCPLFDRWLRDLESIPRTAA